VSLGIDSRLSFTSRVVSFSMMSRASSTERASRSSLATRVSPARQAVIVLRSPAGRDWFRSSIVDVDPLGVDAERGEHITLGGEVLVVGEDPQIPDLERRHRHSVPVSPRFRNCSPNQSYRTPPPAPPRRAGRMEECAVGVPLSAHGVPFKAAPTA